MLHERIAVAPSLERGPVKGIILLSDGAVLWTLSWAEERPRGGAFCFLRDPLLRVHEIAGSSSLVLIPFGDEKFRSGCAIRKRCTNPEEIRTPRKVKVSQRTRALGPFESSPRDPFLVDSTFPIR